MRTKRKVDKSIEIWQSTYQFWPHIASHPQRKPQQRGFAHLQQGYLTTMRWSEGHEDNTQWFCTNFTEKKYVKVNKLWKATLKNGTEISSRCLIARWVFCRKPHQECDLILHIIGFHNCGSISRGMNTHLSIDVSPWVPWYLSIYCTHLVSNLCQDWLADGHFQKYTCNQGSAVGKRTKALKKLHFSQESKIKRFRWQVWLHKMLSLTVCKASDQMFSGIQTLWHNESCFVMTWSNVPKETMKLPSARWKWFDCALAGSFVTEIKRASPRTLGPVQNHRCGKSMETETMASQYGKKTVSLFTNFLPIFVRGARASNQTALPGDERISAPPLTLDSNWKGNSRPWTAKS